MMASKVITFLAFAFLIVDFGTCAPQTMRNNGPRKIKRVVDDNPFAKQLENWKPEEFNHLEYGSPEWNIELFKYLLNQKEGGNVHDLSAFEEMNGHVNVICKMEPFNECFSLDENGGMKYLGAQQRPVRLLRIY